MPPSRGPLGDLPGLTYDPVKNRYFPTREEEPPKPAVPEDTSVRGSSQQRLKNRQRDGEVKTKTLTVDQGRSSKAAGEKDDRRSRRSREGKAVNKAVNGDENSEQHESTPSISRRPAANRIDRTLLRATGLQLGHHDRFSGPTFAESQRRKR